ncbi:FAD-dependent oxidoreductase [Geodermatophilus sabuli]|uniref:NADPH-dependent 2,4-dienoyl-CoA reductase, sulfur reductase n=1 Tax=Geodermatophilus sabuli TaxID=1564158 RepID=A0A285EB46_9ACTN|nr:FAD-dependent oxidoreductase [Geodermatophilus sabuli]MBB3085158.1 NADPH-dependent 2,4-dienoyl-CoA reductase/sulfur reductase-like enzyme [Geodermatophilus sabuli]SNX95434.1 NADPH-dependent 2,4-dienoyl-CoA reductase, sulfur reductase [Geodermatophilus sabuli]
MGADRFLVIGGDAAGMSAAAQTRRLRGASDLAITVLEQGPDVSYSACGIPYWVGDVVSDRDRLIARTPHEFAAQDIDVRTGTRAEAIDLDAGTVRTVDGQTLGYDHLLVATGGRPLRPPVPGLDADGVHGVHRLADGADIRAAVAAGARRAVVLGGGYIGLEMADVLHARGLAVTVVLADPLPMALLDADMGERVCKAIGDMGIDVQPDQPVREIETDADGVVRAVRTDAGSYPCDLVVLGLGMGPEVSLARDAGLRLGETGAIEVDRTMRSRSHPEVFAAGDCVQTFHRLTGEPAHVALGTHANKQGRVVGSVVGGRAARFAGVLGTALTAVGELEIGRTGLCTTQAEAAGYDVRAETIEGTTRAGYFPGAAEIAVKLVSDRGSGELLGAQVVGGPGSGKRIDVLATAIWAGLTAEEFAGSDLSYAPPFAPVHDPVLVAARVASRAERG